MSFNDIVEYSKSEGNHKGHLKVVLKILREPQLHSKYKKYEFWLRSMAFLSHIIFIKGVEVYPRKVDAVKNWPRTLTPTDIRSFLGLECCYWRFVDGFASIETPLTTLTKRVTNLSGWRHVKEVSKF